MSAEWVLAVNGENWGRVFDELTALEMRALNRSSSAFPDRTAAEVRTSYEELAEIVASAQSWSSIECWLSPHVGVTRHERRATGHDGELFEWTKLCVLETHNGRLDSLCEFELDDEVAAFAYAEERVRAADSRLTVSNRASATFSAALQAARRRDVDAMTGCYDDELFQFEDRRRLRGNPLDDLRTAAEGILAQYDRFEERTLAVRGERLHLGWSRWSNEAGYETAYLYVHEVGEDGRFIYESRFDEDDFTSAYRELTRRYCVGEGALFADVTTLGSEWLMTLNEGCFDRVFNEMTDPDARLLNRSSSAFPDRSAAELRASFEELYALVRSVRSWNSAEYWLSSTCGVVRHEREAIGTDGEQFSWTRLMVFEARGGRCTGWCGFELDDEAAAFAYAEDRVREAERG